MTLRLGSPLSSIKSYSLGEVNRSYKNDDWSLKTKTKGEKGKRRKRGRI